MKRMKRFWITLLFALAATGAVQAQYDMLVLNPDARSSGMGGVAMTGIGSSHAIFGNASAALFSRIPYQISSTYSGHDGGNYYAVSGYGRLGGRSVLEAGWRMFDYRGGSDMAFDASYSRFVIPTVALGITARYVRYNPDASSSNQALAVDLSASSRLPLPALPENSALLLGAKLANLGGYLNRSVDGQHLLPVNLQVGAALDWWILDSHELTLAADYGYYFTPGVVSGSEISVGVEYNLMQLVQFRGGYHVGQRSRYYPNYGSVGVGLRFMHVRLDLSYLFASRSSLLHNAYSLSLGLDF